MTDVVKADFNVFRSKGPPDDHGAKYVPRVTEVRKNTDTEEQSGLYAGCQGPIR